MASKFTHCKFNYRESNGQFFLAMLFFEHRSRFRPVLQLSFGGSLLLFFEALLLSNWCLTRNYDHLTTRLLNLFNS